MTEQPPSPLTEGYSRPPPSGWYPDPSGAAGKRYWDGTAWIEQAGALPKKAYTSWISRVVAFIVDLFVLGIIARIANPVLDTVRSNVITAIVLLAVLAFLMWNGFYRQGRTGSSIGKSALKFKVVSERTGQPIGFGLSVVRWLAHFPDLICGIGFLPLFTAKRQTIADMIMKTVCLPIDSTWATPQQPLQPAPARRSRAPWIIAVSAAVVELTAASVGAYFLFHKSPSTAPITLPFTGLTCPDGVAVDSARNVYVTDNVACRAAEGRPRVLKLAAGSSTPIELPFTVTQAEGVAVDSAGNVYGASGRGVEKLAPGATTPTPLPFTGQFSDAPGVAVDTAGNLYVADENLGVLKLAVGSTTPTRLPFDSGGEWRAVAVDGAGNVYAVGDGAVGLYKLAAGSTTGEEFVADVVGEAVAVDTAGAVYVADTDNQRVLKLPPR
jgi:uncharacterized RDD family membrane protein YckC